MEYKSFDEAVLEEKYKTCDKCGRSMQLQNFYRVRDVDRFPPDGRINTCKKCLTMHINNYDPKTFLPILELLDVPYVETEWNRFTESEREKDPHKAATAPVLGRYLSYMKLEQWKNYTFKDSDYLNKTLAEAKSKVDIQNIEFEDEEKKTREKKKDDDFLTLEGLTPEILKNLSDTDIATLFPDLEEKPEDIRAEVDALDFDKNELTIEDKQYLALKWGKLYKTDEWIKLEQFYNEMLQSFDIQTASHYDYLKKICKTSLKMEQALDVGDIEGFQKLSKVYDSLMKSANFTAIQNKEDANFFVSSIGEMVALCEEKGFITDFNIEVPKDIVDFTLRDMNLYLQKLVKNELGLSNMIEAALTKMQQINEEEAEGASMADLDEDEILMDVDELFEDVIEEMDLSTEEVGEDDGLEGYIG